MNNHPETTSSKNEKQVLALLNNAEGKIGYILAWLVGVPIWVLLIVFVIRGH